MIRLLRDGVAAIGFAGILSSASAATFRWSAEVSVLDMVPRHGAVAYIMNCGSVLARIEFADLEVSDRADAGGGLDHDDFHPTSFAAISGETSLDGFSDGAEFDLVVKAWIDMLAEERDWFDMAANPFVLGESAEPHAFLLSCGVAYYTDAPRIDIYEALAKPLRTEGFPSGTRHGGRGKRPRRGRRGPLPPGRRRNARCGRRPRASPSRAGRRSGFP